MSTEQPKESIRVDIVTPQELADAEKRCAELRPYNFPHPQDAGFFNWARTYIPRLVQCIRSADTLIGIYDSDRQRDRETIARLEALAKFEHSQSCTREMAFAPCGGTDGLGQPREPRCQCGADEHNAKVNAIMAGRK